MLCFDTVILLGLFFGSSLMFVINSLWSVPHSLLLVLFWQREYSFSPSCFQLHSLFDFCIGHLVMFMCIVVCSLVWSMCLWWTGYWLCTNPRDKCLLYFWLLVQIFQQHLILLYFLLLCSSRLLFISMCCSGVWSINFFLDSCMEVFDFIFSVCS